MVEWPPPVDRWRVTETIHMRVLFIRDHLAWSGGTIYFLETLPRLDSSRMQPILCVLHPRSPVAEEFEAQGIRPLFLERPKRDPRRFSDLVRLSRNMKSRSPSSIGPQKPSPWPLGRSVHRNPSRCSPQQHVAGTRRHGPHPASPRVQHCRGFGSFACGSTVGNAPLCAPAGAGRGSLSRSRPRSFSTIRRRHAGPG